MYRFDLTESYIPAQTDDVVLETTVGGILRAAVRERSDATALVEVDERGENHRRWTFAELLADSERLAAALASRYAPGERLVVWAPNVPEWVLMEFACGFAGLVLVTANPSYQKDELRYVLEQSGASALFSVASFRGNPMAEIGAVAAGGLDAVREIVDLDDPDALFRIGERPAALPGVAPGDAAQIQYTSGTTGFPKGAVLSHRALTNNARFFARRTDTRPDSVWANFMPMFHTSGCGMITLGALQAGCPVFLVKQFDPAAVLRLIERERVTAALGVPTMLVAMLECLDRQPPDRQPCDLSSVEIAVSGGSMVAPELVRKCVERFGCSFQTVFGQTESAPLITQHHAGEPLDIVCNTAGLPMPQTEVSIRSVDGENRVLPVGEVGEICVRGYCVMIGYHDNPSASADAIDADGWLHTGDLGTLDCQGYLRITGRVKEMIIRGGENLFPAEIENTLLEHPDVAEVAVVGLPDEKWGEIVACFVRLEP
ncbi:MAG: AMP-binding protein, partial [Gemmatimonadetes bacterium]|nr:AMP-binding protein [Gemmatimonadota bacterium]